jgi:hypothetical protein
MTDVLIRDVPEDDLARFDRAAAARNMSRPEYLRSKIASEPEPPRNKASLGAFQRLAKAIRDVEDSDVMAGAWS